MNWEHLRAFLWLHSRLRANKSKRAGKLSNTMRVILLVVAVIAAIAAFSVALAAGKYALRDSPPFFLLASWDALVAVFIFAWILALLTDLQRSELLPLEKFMHFPVSISGLFLINYVASLLSEHVAMFIFVPAMFGLATGLTLGRGAGMLWQFPLLGAFVLMVSAITYQFRGWLAVLMLNKRHRRTVISVVTISTILLFQLPRLVMGPRRGRPAMTDIANRQQVERTMTTASEVLPIGWLPYGAMASAEGRYLPSVLGIAGMTLIGAFSLRRSYRTTMRLYTGNYGSGRTSKRRVETASALPQKRGQGSMLERSLPWISEQASVVALATFRSFTRAPESKMVLLSPLLLMFFFGASVARWSSHPSEFTRPLIASGILMTILFSMSQLAANQFAFDRSGFRNFVLTAASRRDILLGKNLALIPAALGMAGVALSVLQWVFPMRLDHFIAVLFQMWTMYFLFCMFTNCLSIVNPTAIAAGSLRPAARLSGRTLLFGLLTMLLFPLAMAPSMIPLALEYGVHWMGWYPGVPVFLILSIVEAVAVGSLYFWILDLEGRMLQSRELRILEIVTAHSAAD